MALTPPPTAPNRNDPATFSARADAFLAWFVTFVTEWNNGQILNGMGKGTLAAPTLAFTGDTNTGLMSPADGEIAMVSDAIARLVATKTGFQLNGTPAGTGVQDATDDATANRLLKVGAFGLGGNAIPVTVAQLNALTVSGFYRMTEVINNVLDNTATVIHIQTSSGARQIAYRAANNYRYTRYKIGANAWTDWVREDPERGNNANGEYVRFQDGTQIAYASVNSSTSADSTWTFPASFVGTPYVQITAQSAASRTGVTVAVNATTATFNLYDSNGTRQMSTGRLMAVGRWF